MDAPTTDAGTLYRRHASFMTGFISRLGVPGSDVEDVVQEVFLVAHRRGGYVAGAARPTTWLAEIALRVVWKHRRARGRRREDVDAVSVSAVPSSESGPARAAEANETLVRVQRALDALELDRRAIFILFELEGESCDAIAAGLAIPLSTVYSRLNTARQAFLHEFERITARESKMANAMAEPGTRA